MQIILICVDPSLEVKISHYYMALENLKQLKHEIKK